MAYVLPVFNQVCDFWAPSSDPATDPPDMTDQPCQIYLIPKPLAPISFGTISAHSPPIFFRLPYEFYVNWGFPMVEGVFSHIDDQGNQWFYEIEWWEIAHAGFANQYLVCMVAQCDTGRTVPDPAR